MKEMDSYIPSKETSLKEIAFNKELEKLRTIPDGLGNIIEDGVIKQCAYLNCMKMYTRQSCEGHLDSGYPFPWIDICSEYDPTLEHEFNAWNDRRIEVQKHVMLQSLQELGISEVFPPSEEVMQNITDSMREKIKETFHKKFNELEEYLNLKRLKDAFHYHEVNQPFELNYSELSHYVSDKLPEDVAKEVWKTKNSMFYRDHPDSELLNIEYYENILTQKKEKLNKDLYSRVEEFMKSYKPEDKEFGYVFNYDKDNLKITASLCPKIFVRNTKHLKSLSLSEKQLILEQSRKAFAHFSEYLKEYYYKNN